MPWIIMMSIYFMKPLLPKSNIILLQHIKLRKRCISSSSISIIMYYLSFTHPSWYMIYEFGSKQKCLYILFLIFWGLEKFKGYEKINISPFIIMMHRMQWQKNNGIYHVLSGVYMKCLTTRKVIFKLLHRPTRQFVGCLTKIVNFKCFE